MLMRHCFTLRDDDAARVIGALMAIGGYARRFSRLSIKYMQVGLPMLERRLLLAYSTRSHDFTATDFDI